MLLFMNSSAIGHICMSARISQVFRKVGCTSLDIEAIRKIQIEPRDFPEKSTKTQSEGSKENKAMSY